MLITGLLGLALMGALVTWAKQFPYGGETLRALPRKRRRLTILAVPGGLVLAATFALLFYSAGRGADGTGYGFARFRFWLGFCALGFFGLAVLAVSRVVALRQASSADLRQHEAD